MYTEEFVNAVVDRVLSRTGDGDITRELVVSYIDSAFPLVSNYVLLKDFPNLVALVILNKLWKDQRIKSVTNASMGGVSMNFGSIKNPYPSEIREWLEANYGFRQFKIYR